MVFKTNPAPWLVRDGFIYGSNGNLVAESHGYEGDNYLIAAAPELLQALQLIVSYHDDGNRSLHREDLEMARKAIAKALGQQ
ncbi:TPA: hypothetical protein ACKRY6_003215 [Proteus mirabilis]